MDMAAEVKALVEENRKEMVELQKLASLAMQDRDEERKRRDRMMNVLQALILAALMAMATSFFAIRDDVLRFNDWMERTEATRFKREDGLRLEQAWERTLRDEFRRHEREQHGR